MNLTKQAKKIIRKILNYCTAINLKMELDFVQAVGDLFIIQVELAPGTTESKVRNILGDVQQSLGLQLLELYKQGMELFFVVSEYNTFDNRSLGILTSPSYPEHTKGMKLPVPLGFNVLRKPIIVDLVSYYNWLIAGAGGSGKTTALQNLIASLIWHCSPKDLNLVIIDEPANLAQFNGLPHNSCPVIHNAESGFKAIMKQYKEMKCRFKLKEENPDEFKNLPTIVSPIDECVSLVGGLNKQKSEILAKVISLLLRMGRHAKILLILATQNPSLDEMKCDLSPITSRLAFKVGKPHHSVTILGEGGAEKLLGNGEMYFISQKHPGHMYLKGAYISPEEIDKVCTHVCEKWENTAWDDSRKFIIDSADLQPEEDDIDDDLVIDTVETTQEIEDKLFSKIIIWTLSRETVAGNAIYLAFKDQDCGTRKADRFLERLCKYKIAGDAKAKQGRKVIPTCLNDLSDEVISFLNHHGYTTADIETAFADRCKGSTEYDAHA